MDVQLIHGADVVQRGLRTPDRWVALADGVVVASGSGDDWRDRPELHAVDVTDARAGILVPGFIDLHSHGGGGVEFGQADGRLAEAVDVHARRGTTRTALSLVSMPREDLLAQIAALVPAVQADPRIVGLHLEGPYLAPLHCGAHRAEHLRLPTADELRQVLEVAEGRLVQLTIAPELPGATAAIGMLCDAGVRVAVGHTAASYEQARAAFDAGASLLTHAFNAMPGLHHRLPGPLLAALESEHVTIEVINDGVHVHPGLVRLLFTLAPGRVALISDAMAAAGTGDGRYRLGDSEVIVADGVARISDSGAIAGSTITVVDAVRRATGDVGLELPIAVDAATRVPATAIGRVDDLGHLDVGAAGDAVLLDAELDVRGVWIAGTRLR